MFDVGFTELLLIGVVALVVLGPERLPRVARVAGMWVGKARRTLSSVKQEIDRELKAEELNRILDQQSKLNPLDTILEEPSNTAAPEPRSPEKASSPTATKPDHPPRD